MEPISKLFAVVVLCAQAPIMDGAQMKCSVLRATAKEPVVTEERCQTVLDATLSAVAQRPDVLAKLAEGQAELRGSCFVGAPDKVRIKRRLFPAPEGAEQTG